MPKKFRQQSLSTKPQSSAPASLRLAAGASAKALDRDVVPSVNDLIHKSRYSQSEDRSTRPTHKPTSASVHPSLRSILDIPVMLPPRPREGSRNTGPTRTRRIPGPPPPQSGFLTSIHASRSVKDSDAVYNTRIQEQSCKLPGAQFPAPTSLRHLVMKSMAQHWAWHVDYDYDSLPNLPTALKEVFLSYLCLYSEAPDVDALRALFPPPSSLAGHPEFVDDSSDVVRLDLGKAINESISVMRIGQRLFPGRWRRQDIPRPEWTPLLGVNANETPDSWDAVPTESETSQYSEGVGAIPDTLRPPLRFPKLLHLSLAISPDLPAHKVSWPDLLHVAEELSTLTSLSLAYWPLPTYLPRAATTRATLRNPISSSIPAVSYGGTDIYTAFDDNWREAAGILRSLSRSLYCLKWLELTGCGSWLSALTWRGTPPQDDEHVMHRTGSSPTSPATSGPEWNGSWRGIEYVGLGVGWTPAPPTTTTSPGSPHQQQKPNEQRLQQAAQVDSHYGFIPGRTAEMFSRLALNPAPESTSAVDTEGWDPDEERRKYYHRKEVERYMQAWHDARKVAKELKELRRQAGGKWIDVDFGERLGS